MIALSPVTLDTALDTLIEGLETVAALTTEVADSTTGDGSNETEKIAGDSVILAIEGGPCVLIKDAVEEITVEARADMDVPAILFCKAAQVVESVYEVVRNPFALVKKRGAPE